MDIKTVYIFVILIIVIFGSIFVLRYYSEAPDNPYLGFAQCIKESDTTFYGVFWCNRCIEQKRLFGRAAKELPYVECSTPDRSAQQICIDEGIEGYPTWRFGDGSELTGVQELSILAGKTNCSLPVTPEQTE